MKKILSLAIVLVLAMTAVSVLAEGSKTGDDIPAATVVTAPNKGNQEKEEQVSLEIIDDTEETAAVIQLFKDAFDAGDVLAPLPEDVRSKIPEDRTNINEMVTARFVGDVEALEDDLKIILQLDTPYEKDQEVSILFGKLGDPVAWKVFEAIGTEDGKLEFTLHADEVKEYGNDPFVLAVASA